MIIGIDPGGTTGVAVHDKGNYITFAADDPKKLYSILADCIPGVEVVIEQFKAQKISTYGLHTVRIVGGVEALCYTKKLNLVIQQPQQRKAFQNMAHQILNDNGYPYVIHEEDSLAHLLRRRYELGEMDADGITT